MSTNYEQEPWWATSPPSNGHEKTAPVAVEATRAGIALAASPAIRVAATTTVARPVTTVIAARPIAATVALSQVSRPVWQLAALPSLIIEPVSAARDPLRVGDFLLWPDPATATSEVENDVVSAELPHRPIDRPI